MCCSIHNNQSGFMVLIDIGDRLTKKKKHLSAHTKMVLVITAVLIVILDFPMLTSLSPCNVLIPVSNSTASVVVFTPPPVDDGEAPLVLQWASLHRFQLAAR